MNKCIECGGTSIYCKNMCKKCYNRQSHKNRVEKKRKIEEDKREHMNEYLIQYKTKSEEINIYQKQYYKNHPVLQFLGKSIPLLYHGRAPEGYVWHHTCYDHADPEANIVLLSRTSHNQGHDLLRKLRKKIPHINDE